MKTIKILLVEDNPADVLLLQNKFIDIQGVSIDLKNVERLSDAITTLKNEKYDVVLLDLGLPDSQGIDTFNRLHQEYPGIPVLLLTALDDENLSLQTLQEGAQDYLLKSDIEGESVIRSLKFAMERNLSKQTEEIKQRKEKQDRELESITRLSIHPRTAISAKMYSGGALREILPEEFDKAVIEYGDILDLALEQRVFKMENVCSMKLQELGDRLGFLHSGPRDIIEIHSTALKIKLDRIPPQKAEAYLEEARLTVLELMGNLTTHYRLYFSGKSKG